MKASYTFVHVLLKIAKNRFCEIPSYFQCFPRYFYVYFVLINFISPFCFEGKDHLPNVVSSNHRPCCIRYSQKNFSLTATVDV